jgi:ABC-type branched-subunit amino acid transport system substrate-binding protein
LRAKPHPYFFTTMASYSDEVAQMMRNQKTLLRNRIAVLYMDNALGQQMLPVVRQLAKEEGVDLAAQVPLKGDGSDAAERVREAMAARPEGMILIAFGPMIVPVIKQWRAASGPPAYAISIANSRRLVEAMGPDARALAFTQLIPDPARKVSALARDFNAAMDKAGLPVDRDHYFGFLNMRVMLECLARAGRGVTSSSLVTAIESMGRVDLGGYTVNYSPQNHHGSKFVDITIVGPGGRYLS